MYGLTGDTGETECGQRGRQRRDIGDTVARRETEERRLGGSGETEERRTTLGRLCGDRKWTDVAK